MQWKPDSNSEPEILNPAFPRAVAAMFSSKWADLFPPMHKTPASSNTRNAYPQTLTIVGGTKDSATLILRWMLSCCEGHGVQNFQRVPFSDRPFSRCFFLKETAEIMGIDHLVKEFDARMQAIAARQVHSEDIRALYLRLPANHDVLKFLAKHVATLIWNHELKNRSVYNTLREEIPAFDQDINEVLDPLVEARRQEQQAEWETRREREWETRRAERAKEAMNNKNEKGKQKKPATKAVEEVSEPVEPEGPGVVPGVEESSQVRYPKNKAAKRRQKHREQKAKEAGEGSQQSL